MIESTIMQNEKHFFNPSKNEKLKEIPRFLTTLIGSWKKAAKHNADFNNKFANISPKDV